MSNNSHFTMDKYVNLLQVALSPKEIKEQYIIGCSKNLIQLIQLYSDKIKQLIDIKQQITDSVNDNIGLQEYKLPEILDESNKYDIELLELGINGTKEQQLQFINNLLKQWQDDQQYYINEQTLLNSLQLD